MGFEAAVDLILDLEGNDTLTDDPRDPGGVTRYGISQRAFPSADIRNLTREQAIDLYRTHYWARVRGDDLPWPVALAVFDGAVNQGQGTAVKALQRAVGVSADGVLGQATIAAVRTLPASEVLKRVMQERMAKYLSLNKPEYTRGWANRIIAVTVAALT